MNVFLNLNKYLYSSMTINIYLKIEKFFSVQSTCLPPTSLARVAIYTCSGLANSLTP